jgi:hypothetical protein
VFSEVYEIQKEGRYKTAFGPRVQHTGLLYGRWNDNIALAFQRMNQSRGSYKEERQLRANQDDWFTKNNNLARHMGRRYHRYFDDYQGYVREAELHHADKHPKKKLRVWAWNKIKASGTIFDSLYADIIRAKLKWEIGKHGKIPRLYADYGECSSLLGFRLMECLKTAMASESLKVNGGEIQFIKSPKQKYLRETFQKLIDPPEKFYASVFSDDGCLSFRNSDKIYRANIDISSCDLSHYTPVFKQFMYLVPRTFRHELKMLLRQCLLPMKVTSAGGTQSVTFLPREHFLGSGHVITTAINTFVLTCIMKEITTSDHINEASILAAAKRLGYLVTVDECETIYDLQFLKHSPVYDVNGKLQPLLNPGVFMRLSGSCDGDLPGKGDLRARGIFMQQALILCTYPRASFPLIEEQRKSLEVPDKYLRYFRDKMTYKVDEDEEDEYFTVASADMWKRYRLTPLEIQIIEFEFGRAGYGHFVSGLGYDKVLQKDYELTTI